MCSFTLDCPECAGILYRISFNKNKKQLKYGCKHKHRYNYCKYCKQLFNVESNKRRVRLVHYLHFYKIFHVFPCIKDIKRN